MCMRHRNMLPPVASTMWPNPPGGRVFRVGYVQLLCMTRDHLRTTQHITKLANDATLFIYFLFFLPSLKRSFELKLVVRAHEGARGSWKRAPVDM